MILIQEVLVSFDVFTEEFKCKISSCKGACCREGDFGAPLNEEELELLDKYGTTIAQKYLNTEAQSIVKEKGFYEYFDEMRSYGTMLRKDQACIFLSDYGDGIESCGIQKAFEYGDIPFEKPISCALYPIRVEEDPTINFKAVNYDRWSICSEACSYGADQKLKVFQFLREPIIRKFGESFFQELEEISESVMGVKKDFFKEKKS